MLSEHFLRRRVDRPPRTSSFFGIGFCLIHYWLKKLFGRCKFVGLLEENVERRQIRKLLCELAEERGQLAFLLF